MPQYMIFDPDPWDQIPEPILGPWLMSDMHAEKTWTDRY